MATVECEHGAIGAADVAVCPPCQRTLADFTDEPGEFGRPFEALYHGRCGGCRSPVRPGEMIVWRDVDGHADYRHAGVCVEGDL